MNLMIKLQTLALAAGPGTKINDAAMKVYAEMKIPILSVASICLLGGIYVAMTDGLEGASKFKKYLVYICILVGIAAWIPEILAFTRDNFM